MKLQKIIMLLAALCCVKLDAAGAGADGNQAPTTGVDLRLTRIGSVLDTIDTRTHTMNGHLESIQTTLNGLKRRGSISNPDSGAAPSLMASLASGSAAPTHDSALGAPVSPSSAAAPIHSAASVVPAPAASTAPKAPTAIFGPNADSMVRTAVLVLVVKNGWKWVRSFYYENRDAFKARGINLELEGAVAHYKQEKRDALLTNKPAPKPSEKVAAYMQYKEEHDAAAKAGKNRPAMPALIKPDMNWRERLVEKIDYTTYGILRKLFSKKFADDWRLGDKGHKNKDKYATHNGSPIRDEYNNHIMLKEIKPRGWGKSYHDAAKIDPLIDTTLTVATIVAMNHKKLGYFLK